MHLTLVMPGFFWQDPGDIDNLYRNVKTPNFNYLVKQARLDVLNYSYSSFFYTASTNLNSGPLAIQLATSLNISHKYKYFLIAEPTHLRLDRDRLLIAEPDLLQLDHSEEEHLINAINQHFAGEIELFYVNENLWLIGHNLELKECVFYPILDIVGENIDEYLPKHSSDAIQLNKIINEIQMLLFSLPLYRERTLEGSLTVNSLWLSDTILRPQLLTPYKYIIANNLKHLTNHAKILPIPANIESSFCDNNLIVIDNLYYPCRYRDSFGWLDQLHILDETIGLTLRKLLSKGKIRELKILIPDQVKTLCLTIRYINKYKFWQNKQLINLVKDSHAL